VWEFIWTSLFDSLLVTQETRTVAVSHGYPYKVKIFSFIFIFYLNFIIRPIRCCYNPNDV